MSTGCGPVGAPSTACVCPCTSSAWVPIVGGCAPTGGRCSCASSSPSSAPTPSSPSAARSNPPTASATWAIIERFFAAAKRYYRLDTDYAAGWDAVLQRTTITFCAILVVALAAPHDGASDLRLPPSRVLAHYLPVEEAA